MPAHCPRRPKPVCRPESPLYIAVDDSDAPAILTVENEGPLHLMLAQMLAGAGYATVEAHTSDDALVDQGLLAAIKALILLA